MAKPSVTNSLLWIDPGDLPSFRSFNGSFVAVNRGFKSCNLTNVQILHESLTFKIYYVVEEKNRDLKPKDEDATRVQLPMAISRNKEIKILITGSHDVETLKELPQSVSLKVTFDCRKEPLMYSMVRETGTRKYLLHWP